MDTHRRPSVFPTWTSLPFSFNSSEGFLLWLWLLSFGLNFASNRQRKNQGSLNRGCRTWIQEVSRVGDIGGNGQKGPVLSLHEKRKPGVDEDGVFP